MDSGLSLTPTPALTIFPFPSSSPHVPTFYLPCPTETGAYILQQVLFITRSLFLGGKKVNYFSEFQLPVVAS